MGKVTRIQEATNGYELVVHVEVTEDFKGSSTGETIKIWTNKSGAACGYKFYIGQTYLIYASKHLRMPGELTTSVCSRTCHVRDAENDLIFMERETGREIRPEWRDQFREVQNKQ